MMTQKLCLLGLVLLVTSPVTGQETAPAELHPEDLASIGKAMEHGLDFLVKGQKEDGHMPAQTGLPLGKGGPISHRVAGTAICALALVRAPGYAESKARQQAVRDATEYITTCIQKPTMAHDVEAFRDMHKGNRNYNSSSDYFYNRNPRMWGYTYGLLYLLELRSRQLLAKDQEKAADKAIRFFLDGIKKAEMDGGGWYYVNVGPEHTKTSVIITAPTLHALFEARRQGLEFDHEMVTRGLKRLQETRTETGTWPYVGVGGANLEKPSSLGRSLVCESTLFRAGRSKIDHLREALDAFFEHWEWFEKARSGQRPHMPPYGIASYYFFYGHYYASMAIELLPEEERAEYRHQLVKKLAEVRLDNGAWSDRVDWNKAMPESLRAKDGQQLYKSDPNAAQLTGTAFAVLILCMSETPPLLTRWEEGSRKNQEKK